MNACSATNPTKNTADRFDRSINSCPFAPFKAYPIQSPSSRKKISIIPAVATSATIAAMNTPRCGFRYFQKKAASRQAALSHNFFPGLS